MGLPVEKHIETLPGILQQSVRLWFERLSENGGAGDLDDALAARIAKVVACSEFAGIVLLREWSWFIANVERFGDVGDDNELQQFVADFVRSCRDSEEQASRLRRFRNRFLVRLLWREIHGSASLDDTLRGLTLLADRLLEAVSQVAAEELQEKFGLVRDAAGMSIPLVVLGMGKLGGGELNFSSDIDLIFCYPEAGLSDGRRSLSAQEYFGRLVLKIIALLDEVTADGFVFRVDTRLRPFGDSGPPVISFGGLESYLLQHGRDWERYAYVKARVVGEVPTSAVLDELYGNLIRPFVYRRYLDYGVFESLREMQALIEAEVRRKELTDNIKLGPGGIREAEFIVQALQLVRGGTEPELQSRDLLSVLPRLVGERGLSAKGAEALRLGYRFLRRLENFIQAMYDQQSHDLPGSEIDRSRLCLAMGFENWAALRVAVDGHRQAISMQFSAIAFRNDAPQDTSTRVFSRLWETKAGAAQWREALAPIFVRDAEKIAMRIAQFASARSTQQADATAFRRLQRFIPNLIIRSAAAKRPLTALVRTLAVVERVVRRSAYLSLLNENQGALSRLVDLCEQSLTIADRIARYPILLDELLDPHLDSDSVTKHDLVNELKQRLSDVGNVDSDQQIQLIAKFQRATLFRIAIADFDGRLPVMKVSDALTWLAETVVDEILRVVWTDLTFRHGIPKYKLNGEHLEAGIGVVGYGKLGGLELSYGSDLDIVFLHDSAGSEQRTNGDKPLDNAVFFARLVQRLVHFLTTQTRTGELYEVDTRLRPDGRSGLLVTNTQAFERYLYEHAWTWEQQALLRARAVAGNAAIAVEFDRIRQDTLRHRVNLTDLRNDVIDMRQRMRKELDQSDEQSFDLKNGPGGIGDIEFLVQYLVLRHAGEHAGLVQHSDNIRQLDALMKVACLDDNTGARLQNTYRDYRVYQHQLALDGKPAHVPVTLFMMERDFVCAEWSKWLG